MFSFTQADADVCVGGTVVDFRRQFIVAGQPVPADAHACDRRTRTTRQGGRHCAPQRRVVLRAAVASALVVWLITSMSAPAGAAAALGDRGSGLHHRHRSVSPVAHAHARAVANLRGRRPAQRTASRHTRRMPRYRHTTQLHRNPEYDGTSAARAVAYAYAQLGKPYVYGGTGPFGYDCSGLVQRAWRAAGIPLPRTSQEQARFGYAVDLRQLLPGDLIVYYPGMSHVAIYVGSAMIIDASHPGSSVRLTRVDSMPVFAARRV